MNNSGMKMKSELESDWLWTWTARTFTPATRSSMWSLRSMGSGGQGPVGVSVPQQASWLAVAG